MLEEFKTIKDLEKYFINENTARQYLEDYRWKGNPVCPKCGSNQFYILKTVKQYCCKTCRKNYSVRVGTIFDNSAVPLSKWFTAIFLLSNDRRSMSSVQVGEWIGVTQKTAWFMNHRIRTMMDTNNVELMEGIIQMDEIYTGGKKDKVSKSRKDKMVKGSGSVGKIPVIGIAETETGKKRYIVGDEVTAGSIETIIVNNVSKDSILVTDGSPLYTTVGKEFNNHIALNHSKNEYGKDGYHSNDIEGSFRHFRGYLDGTYKGMVRSWHLQKYANEFIYKNDRREKVVLALNKAKKPSVVLKTILTPENLKKVLRYKDLVLLNPNHNKKWDLQEAC